MKTKHGNYSTRSCYDGAGAEKSSFFSCFAPCCFSVRAGQEWGLAHGTHLASGMTQTKLCPTISPNLQLNTAADVAYKLQTHTDTLSVWQLATRREICANMAYGKLTWGLLKKFMLMFFQPVLHNSVIKLWRDKTNIVCSMNENHVMGQWQFKCKIQHKNCHHNIKIIHFSLQGLVHNLTIYSPPFCQLDTMTLCLRSHMGMTIWYTLID